MTTVQAQDQRFEIHLPDNHYQADCAFETCNVCQELDRNSEMQRRLAKKYINLKMSRNDSHTFFNKKLSVEIIAKIFVFVDEANHHFSFPAESRQPVFPNGYFCAPSVLSSIYIRWREIALSLPRLWANVYVDLGRECDGLTEDWLNRSHPLPLNLTLYAGESREPGETGPNFQLLRSHSARWGYINLHNAPEYCLYNLFNDLKVTPKSDSFYLQLPHRYKRLPIRIQVPLQPSRFDTKVKDFLDDFLGVMPFDWTCLTHLKVSNNGVGDILDVIQQAPKLEHCVLHGIRFDEGVDTTVEPVVNRSLNYLELQFASVYDTRLISNMTLPSLRHLNYDCACHCPPGIELDLQLHDLDRFLSRSHLDPGTQGPLETFALNYAAIFFADDNNSSFLELAAVTVLSSSPSSDGTALRFILRKLLETDVFPHLQELHLHAPWLLRLDPGACALLCDVVTAHNCSAGVRSVDTGLQSERRISADTGSSSGGRYTRRRPLKSIFIFLGLSYGQLDIKIEKDVLLRLRDAQKSGPMEFEFMCSESKVPVEVLGGRSRPTDQDDIVLIKLGFNRGITIPKVGKRN